MISLSSIQHVLPLYMQLIFIGAFGLIFGSFGTMLLCRLPLRQTIRGRSRCPNCAHTLYWKDLIPLFSYILLRGRCRYCSATIALRYPLVELCSCILFVIIAERFFESPLIVVIPLSIAAYTTLLIAFYDLATQRIPDVFLTVLIIAAVCYRAMLSSIDGSVAGAGSLRDAFLGAGVLLGFFGGLWLASYGRWIGSGDILLGAALGLLLGSVGSLLTLFLAYIIGAIFAVALLLLKKVDRQGTLPFGPFLAIGALFSLLFGETILSAYGKILAY